MVAITTIKDPRIRVQISKKLLNILQENQDHIHEIPESLFKAITSAGLELPSNIQILSDDLDNTSQNLNIKLLRQVLKDNNDKIMDNATCNDVKLKEDDYLSEVFLHLNELQWLNRFLSHLRKHRGLKIHLNDVLQTCSLQLPQNELVRRNPELEARCQRLREEQENREYFKMTKNVNSTERNYPEDTIAYQMKAINSQIIAVLQFVFSVAAGFVFGFLGLELIIGNMDFGIRLLLGIMFALIIALAEIYFLAKKLNEYDTAVDCIKHKGTPSTPTKTCKLHHD